MPRNVVKFPILNDLERAFSLHSNSTRFDILGKQSRGGWPSEATRFLFRGTTEMGAVKRTRTVSGKTVSRMTASVGNAETPKKPMRPARCRRFMQDRLAEAFPEIVQGFVESAKSGSCVHMKLAAELLAFEKAPTRRKGSAVKLLERLKRNGDI